MDRKSASRFTPQPIVRSVAPQRKRFRLEDISFVVSKIYRPRSLFDGMAPRPLGLHVPFHNPCVSAGVSGRVRFIDRAAPSEGQSFAADDQPAVPR
jgi:hypothetical protein